LEHKVGAKMKYPANTKDAKRMAKNKFRNSQFFRPFYQNNLHIKILQFASNEWPKDEEKIKHKTTMETKQKKVSNGAAKIGVS